MVTMAFLNKGNSAEFLCTCMVGKNNALRQAQSDKIIVMVNGGNVLLRLVTDAIPSEP
jgi:hypothetical protein